MTLTPRTTLIAGAALILLANAVALTGVYFNRSGEPEARMRLSQRELGTPWDWSVARENSGMVLGLNWRVNDGNAVLVDLRESAEFKAGHIVGALNIPYAKLSKETTEVASYKDKTIILVDKLGQHAGAVGRFLGKEGFDVRRLGGGIAEWQAQSLPLVKGK